MMESRFRSPVVPRKTTPIKETAILLVQNSKRSRSTENSLEKFDPFMSVGTKGSINFENSMSVLNKRWSIIAKNQETMSKQELLNNYRLLMNDHLRLERFLSIITKDNEMARNRLETDLLDAMMCIEDLKQALEVRMARRRKIDPREAEERRSLIRQNKKLLNQLYESAKKIEVLELTKLEIKEQLELLDFQMVEIENQKTTAEEELRRRQPVCEDESTQTEGDLDDGSSALAAAHAENASVSAELANQQAEFAALNAKYWHLEKFVRDLRRDNAELREQVTRVNEETEDVNSLTESDKHTRDQSLQAELTAKIERITVLEEQLAKSQATNEALSAKLRCTQTSGCGSSKNDDDCESEKSRGLYLNAATLQQLTLELNGVDLLNTDSLLGSIRTLKKMRNSLLSTVPQTTIKNDLIEDTTLPEYYSTRFGQLKGSFEAESLRAQLNVCEKRKANLETRVAELLSEISRAQAAQHTNEAALTASRRNEAALRRRLLATMDTGSSSRARPVSSLDYSATSPLEFVGDWDAQTTVTKLELSNTALMEAGQLDRALLQDQATRIAQLEAEKRTLHDRMANLQASESCAQRACVRLQALYEDMLREFSESTSLEASATAARRHPRRTDPRGYETDTAVLTNNADDGVIKLCTAKACKEVRETLHGLQERFICTAEQLVEAETLLAEVDSTATTASGSASSSTSASACRHLLAAIRLCTECGDAATSTLQRRLLARLERWITSQLARRDAVEAQLRQRCADLEVELAKASSDIDWDALKKHLEAQKTELIELHRELEDTQDALEATKALRENHWPDSHCHSTGTRVDLLETL